MGSNHKIDIIYLLDRMLSGKITSVEKIELFNHIQETYKDRDLDMLMCDHWLGLENMELVADEMQLLILKNKIFSSINQIKPLSKSKYQLLSSNWKGYLMRAAAVLFIPLLLISIFIFSQKNRQLHLLYGSSALQQVIASPGSRVHFTLPDQTEVWLNSGSKLEFPLNLNQQDQRKVKLYGQGYFNVKHDAKHPFFVETEILSVKALGTSFDVSSYSEDEQISSTLEEGSIALFNLQGVEVARLFPGQKVVLDKKTKELVVKNVDTALSTSWKDGKLIFRNTSLSEVTIQLERWFNCKIHLDPHLLNSDLMYSATIQDETLGEVLKMIEISTRIKTKIEKREVYINSKN